MIGAALVAVVLGAVAVWLARRPARASAALDTATVAMLPFRVTAPDRSLDYLGEGIVDLLAVKLDGSAGVRAVPPRQLLAALHYRAGRRSRPTTPTPRPGAPGRAGCWTGAWCARPPVSS